MRYPDPKEGELSDLENTMVDVLLEASIRRFTVSSDFARANAEVVAMLASKGYLSTRITRDIYGREWSPTIIGMMYLSEIELEDEEVKHGAVND